MTRLTRRVVLDDEQAEGSTPCLCCNGHVPVRMVPIRAAPNGRCRHEFSVSRTTKTKGPCIRIQYHRQNAAIGAYYINHFNCRVPHCYSVRRLNNDGVHRSWYLPPLCMAGCVQASIARTAECTHPSIACLISKLCEDNYGTVVFVSFTWKCEESKAKAVPLCSQAEPALRLLVGFTAAAHLALH